MLWFLRRWYFTEPVWSGWKSGLFLLLFFEFMLDKIGLRQRFLWWSWLDLYLFVNLHITDGKDRLWWNDRFRFGFLTCFLFRCINFNREYIFFIEFFLWFGLIFDWCGDWFFYFHETSWKLGNDFRIFFDFLLALPWFFINYYMIDRFFRIFGTICVGEIRLIFIFDYWHLEWFVVNRFGVCILDFYLILESITYFTSFTGVFLLSSC